MKSSPNNQNRGSIYQKLMANKNDINDMKVIVDPKKKPTH